MGGQSATSNYCGRCCGQGGTGGPVTSKTDVLLNKYINKEKTLCPMVQFEYTYDITNELCVDHTFTDGKTDSYI